MTITPQRFDVLASKLEGRNLLEASAGTGKTFTIAALYLRLLLETSLTVEQILVVTFTEAATEELRERIRRRLSEALAALSDQGGQDEILNGLVARLTRTGQQDDARRKLREALVCFDEAAIFTIHGFCQRLLQDKAFETGSLFDTELITNQSQLLDEIAQDYWRCQCAGQTGLFAAYLVDKAWTPDQLVRDLKPVAADPDMTVIPELAPVDLQSLADRWQAARTVLHDSWLAGKAEITDLVLTCNALDGRSYPQDKRPRWLAEIEHGLSAEPRFQALATPLDKFRPAALEKATKKNQRTPHHAFFECIETFATIDQTLHDGFDQELIRLKAGFIQALRQELPARKKRQNVRHFDDLLLEVRDTLRSSCGPGLRAAIQAQFRAAFIDEFQDTDPVQFDIFRSLYPDASHPVFFIGDPKQAIYSFRGADIFAYIAATRVVEHRYTLAQNWRSTPELVEAVNHVFSGHDRPFLLADIPFSPVDPKPAPTHDRLTLSGADDTEPLQFWICQPQDPSREDNKGDAKLRLARAVGHEITRLLALSAGGEATIDGRPLQPGDMAVLVRTHKEGGLVQKILRECGIPSVQSGTGSLFDSRQAREIRRVLRAIAEPGHESVLKAALSTDLFGLNGTDLDALDRDEKKLDLWMETFREYNRIWRETGLIAMTGRLLSEQAVRSRLLQLPDGQRRVTNLLHGFELLHQASRDQHLGLDGLLKWFDRQCEEREREEYQIRLESDDNAVKIVTIHKSKGLEYPVVFCPFCWDRGKTEFAPPLFFHNPAAANRRTVDLGSEHQEQHQELAGMEHLAEHMRLLYVALTRARYRCYVGWGRLKGAEKSSLGYLLHARQQPHSLPDTQDNPLVLPEKISLEAMTSELKSLVARGGGCIAAVPLPEPELSAGLDLAPPPEPELTLPDFTRRIDHTWCISSFTRLTAGQTHSEQVFEPERADAEIDTESPAAAPGQDDFSCFMDFPKGATAGSCLHHLFEILDFTNPDPAALRLATSTSLAAFGFDPRWQPVVSLMVSRTLATPLATADGQHICLNRIPRSDRLTEMEFYLPLKGLDPWSLGDVFVRHGGQAGLAEDFASRLKRLGFGHQHGILQGFIDLVFRHADRYYLVDWKSNFLGRQPQDYESEALKPAMQSSYYTLQYHLYLVGLHIFLGRTLPGYRYTSHFGGVIYPFLRGTFLNQQPGQTLGLFADRPDPELIEALAHLLCNNPETP